VNIDDFAERFAAWLNDESDSMEPRRFVRRSGSGIMVSKFDEGFAAHLHASIGRLPEVFERSLIASAYAERVQQNPSAPRVALWHAAAEEILALAGDSRGLSPDDQAEVRAGIDSVAALLDSILWTAPRGGDEYSPTAAEIAAYREARARMDGNPGLFTRCYGAFEGALVENHCPGAPFARRLLTQAWSICTGTEAPAS
jgi:hypothetical protein